MQNKQEITFGLYSNIAIMGIGGGGCNAINRLSFLPMDEVNLIAANTDFHALSRCKADHKIKLGKDRTSGMGTGGDISLGKLAAEESYQEIIDAIKDAHLLFLTAGLGGGTGSGATEIVARIATSLDIPVILIASLPFNFESDSRKLIAHEAVQALQPFANTIITIPNDRLLSVCDPSTKLDAALSMIDDLLIRAIHGITEIINPDGIMNIDFSYIKNMLNFGSGAYMSVGYGSGDNRVIDSINDALSHPLLGTLPLNETRGLIIKMVANLTVDEMDEGLSYIREQAHPDLELIPGIHFSSGGDQSVKTAVMATGIGAIALPYSQSVPALDSTRMDSEDPSKADIVQTEDDQIIYPKSVENFEDELEVPAFIRRGYNLKHT